MEGDPPRYGFLSLVRQPSDRNFETETHAPVKSFQSGFMGAFDEDLRLFATNYAQAGNNMVSSHHFAVLTNARRRHAQLYSTALCLLSTADYFADAEDDIDHGSEDFEEAWKTWRIRFEESGAVVTNLLFTPAVLQTYYYEDFVDVDGAYKVQEARQRFRDDMRRLGSE